MLITQESVTQAFQAHHRRYEIDMNWTVREIVHLWRHGQAAFDEPDDRAAFDLVYQALRNRWLVFRPLATSKITTVDSVHSILTDLNPRLRKLRLSQITTEDAQDIWTALQTASAIKRDSFGNPSLMAVTKFLHFWNPRLFVIVDDGVMGQFVLKHTWLRRSIEGLGISLADRYPRKALGSPRFSSYGLRYLDLLYWAGALIRDNPAIKTEFACYVRENAKGEEIPDGFEDYEASAIEWLLLGLVELPPAGTLVSGRIAGPV